MGRQSYSNRKIVDACLFITTRALKEDHFFDGGVKSGKLRWQGKVHSVDVYVSTVENDEYIRFQYTTHDTLSGERTPFDYKAKLVSTPCHYGRIRWWFLCPMTVDSKPCARRVSALYTVGGKGFGCRHCHNLTYRSSKESHKHDRLDKRLRLASEAQNLFRDRFVL